MIVLRRRIGNRLRAGWNDRRMRFLPERARNRERLDADLCPPGEFVAGLVQVAVMAAAERHDELIAHLHTDRARLCEAEVMRISRLPAANDTGLRGNELQVRLIAQPL